MLLQYVIEVLDGEKIVSRKRGFTVDSCATAISAADEQLLGAEFQFVNFADKVSIELKDAFGEQQLVMVNNNL